MRAARLCIGLILTAVALAAAAPARAQMSPLPGPTAQTENVRASLISELSAVKPGERVWIALRQEIRPRWHTYWLNPGDSGLPTQIEWQLPNGAGAGPIQWPVPNAIKVGPLVNYGYENDLWLLSEITVPADAAPGQKFRIRALAKWLVCEEVCIPEEATLVLALDIGQASAIDAAQRDNFLKARRALPAPAPWAGAVGAAADRLTLRIAMPAEMAARVTQAYFFAATPDAVAHAAPQIWRAQSDGLYISLEAGPVPLVAGAGLPGILRITEQGGENLAFAIDAKPGAVGALADTLGLSLPLALLYALLGGLILNLMPCVFPILSMKGLALMQSAGHDRARARAASLLYVGGVLVGFAAIGAALLALRAGGAAAGWGFQLQAPWFVALLAFLMLVVGLNLSGVYEVGAITAGQQRASRGGNVGSFLTGLLAVAVATPCTAPFMAAALGFALAQPPASSLAIFLALGLGMGLPWLLLAAAPGLLRLLPRPGAWMEWLRRVLAFPMYATALWLLWVLAQQGDAFTLAWAMAGALALGFAAWLYGATRAGGRRAQRLGAILAAISLVVALAMVPLIGQGGAPEPGTASAPPTAGQNWEKFTKARLAELRAAGTPVFVNMTAAWCITCLVNERVALGDSAVIARMKEKGVVYLKGDWTRQDPEITAYLAEFGRSGVPLYVLYPAQVGAAPKILPQILLPADIMAALDGV